MYVYMNTHIYHIVCIHACIYVCIICMYNMYALCMYYVCIMYVHVHVCMHACMHACIFAMYACLRVRLYIHTVDSFSRSFIPNIYIAPLEEIYSEALSVQLQAKRKCLKKLAEGRHIVPGQQAKRA